MRSLRNTDSIYTLFSCRLRMSLFLVSFFNTLHPWEACTFVWRVLVKEQDPSPSPSSNHSPHAAWSSHRNIPIDSSLRCDFRPPISSNYHDVLCSFSSHFDTNRISQSQPFPGSSCYNTYTKIDQVTRINSACMCLMTMYMFIYIYICMMVRMRIRESDKEVMQLHVTVMKLEVSLLMTWW